MKHVISTLIVCTSCVTMYVFGALSGIALAGYNQDRKEEKKGEVINFNEKE